MDIFLHNTLTDKKEKFTPIKQGEVSLYSCGPTVYNYLHIGNLRAYVFADILKRTFEYDGYTVHHIMNVTDIGHLTSDADEGEDKMVKALKREGKPMTLEGLRDVANIYWQKAHEDMQALDIEDAEKNPFASDEIPVQIELIQTLLDKEYAYQISDGIYFDTTKFPHYGELGGVKNESTSEMESRIGINSEKKNPRDFALWKFADKDGIGFDAPFGKGFPGWHIECSAMSMKYLGHHFDIHTGGIDHIPVHHNNEIAQSEAATGEKFVNYWMHNAHLTIANGDNSEKMAKSGDNFLTLDFLKKNGISPLAYRYWLLTARYSTRMDYSTEAIKGAQTAYERLTNSLASFPDGGKIDETYKERFSKAINDDLDTPKALALTWELIRDKNISEADKKATILNFDKVFGLKLGQIKKEDKDNIEIPKEVQELLHFRKLARESGDFAQSDAIRKEIQNKGYSVKDQKDGTQLLTKI